MDRDKEIDLTPGQDWQAKEGRPGESLLGSNFWPFVGYFAAFFAAAWTVNQFLR